MSISFEISEKFELDKSKNDILYQFKTVCMNCLKEFPNYESKHIRKYKGENIKKYFKTHHLYHYSCDKCICLKSKYKLISNYDFSVCKICECHHFLIIS